MAAIISYMELPIRIRLVSVKLCPESVCVSRRHPPQPGLWGY